MFHIDRELDYNAVIGSDHRESWGSSQLYPAIVRVHTEMPPQDVPLHWHLGMELVYVRRGNVMMFVDGSEITIHEGQLCLVGPKALHSIHPQPHGNEQNVLSISFDGEYLSRMCPDLAGWRINQGIVYGFDGIADGELLGLCERITLCVDGEESPLRMVELNSLLYQLLLHICTRCAQGVRPRNRPHLQRCGKQANYRNSPNTWNVTMRRKSRSAKSPNISDTRVNTSLDCSNAALASPPTSISRKFGCSRRLTIC